MAKGGALGVSPAMLQAILGSAPGGFPGSQGGMGAAMGGAAQSAAEQYRMFNPSPMPHIPYMPQAQVGPQAIPIGQIPQPAQPAAPPSSVSAPGGRPGSPQGYFNAPGLAGPRPAPQQQLASAFGAGGLMGAARPVVRPGLAQAAGLFG